MPVVASGRTTGWSSRRARRRSSRAGPRGDRHPHLAVRWATRARWSRQPAGCGGRWCSAAVCSGVETACALRERGVAVTLVHDGETLLDKTIRLSAGRRVTRAVRELGVEVLLNTSLDGTDVRGTGGSGRCSLRSGRQVFGELLVVACGVRPRTELATGLTVRTGIVVDRTLDQPGRPTGARDRRLCRDRRARQRHRRVGVVAGGGARAG